MGKLSSLKRLERLHPHSRQLRRLRELQEEYLRDLDPDELGTITHHLEGPYQSMDRGYKGERYGSPELAEKMETLISGAPRLDEPMTVFRGTSGEGLIPDEGYPLTTTVDPGAAGTYAEGHAFDADKPSLLTQLEVPEGSPGLAMPNDDLYRKLTGELPPFGDEMELILPTSAKEFPLLERFMPETVYEHSTSGPDEAALKMPIEKRQYKPPYKARGGLVNVSA